jgi:hypothetical protein
MRKWIVLAVAVIAMLVAVGCGYQEGIRQPDRQSYIWFSGETKEAVVIIDDNEPFEVERAASVDSETWEKVSGRLLYQVKPGKHEVVVKKGGQVVVHRDLMIGAGTTKEVWVP